MFHLDNNSGISSMPPAGAVESSAPRWFTEGGGGTPASYPGAAWFNIIQAELLNVLSAYGVAPDKADLTQLKKAIEEAIRQKATAASALLTAIAALNTSANKLPYFNGKDTVTMTDLTAFARELLGLSDAAGVLSKLGLKSAAQRDVGTGSNQIPDMSAFQSGKSGSVTWSKFPDGTIIQRGTVVMTNGALTFTLPVAMPSNIFTVVAMDNIDQVANGKLIVGSSVNSTTVQLRALIQGGAGSFVQGGTGTTYFIAISERP